MPDRRLVVVGDGPEMRRLRFRAPPNVDLRGRLPTPEVREHMQRARAFLFAGRRGRTRRADLGRGGTVPASQKVHRPAQAEPAASHRSRRKPRDRMSRAGSGR